MLRRIAFAAAVAPAFVTLAPAAFAQTTQPGAGAPAVRTQPSPIAGRTAHGSHHGGNKRYGPGVLIDASQYVATPNPHTTPFHNTTHNTIPPGEDVFSSQSSK